jgi:triacylglycerol esterase/lipase EstA (alpha/beta hydrolase family)
MADIVFVHGLDGDPRTTWSADTLLEDSFWPMWLSEDLPNAGIWSFGYEANSSGWFGPTMPLTDRATSLLAYCQANGLGLRPLLFITHSMGGLLAKQALRHGHGFGNANWRAIVEQTKGMVFLSTPHTGTSVMSWLDRLSTVLRLRVNVEEMRNHDRRLSELNTWYRAQVAGLGIETLVFCETQPWRGSIIVGEDNADPGIPGVITIPVDANHSTICTQN